VAAADLAYTAAGQPTAASIGSLAQRAWSYDPLTEELVHSGATSTAGQSLLDLAYTLDPMGNVCTVQDGAAPALLNVPHLQTEEKDYSFDALYRLTGATGLAGASDTVPAAFRQSFTYDGSDNLIGIAQSPTRRPRAKQKSTTSSA